MAELNNPQKSSKLSVFTLMMINVAAIMSLRALPGLAEYGWSLIFYLTLASLCFFIPSALVSAELASGWQGEGGVYLWVKEAFGPKWGFVAIFMQWVENLPWFPAVLAFGASAIAYTFNPELAENKWFIVGVIQIALWVTTFLNFRDMKLSAFFSSSGAIVGTIIPGILIIVLGIIHVLSGKPSEIVFSMPALVPDIDSLQQLMLLAAMLVSFLGIEMSAVHVNEVKNPAKNYPRAIFAACLIIILLSTFGSLAIALVIPADGVSLSAGVCQAFDKLFKIHNMPSMTPIICFLLAYGALTMVVTWMVGPSKGIREVAKEGYLPKSWQKTNKYGIPTNILIIQTSLSAILSCVILFMPTVSSAFMLMSALAAQLYLIMYLLMFAAAIRLRYTHPEVKRGYTIPGGKIGIWIVSTVAMVTCLFVIVFGFIPPHAVRSQGMWPSLYYVGFLLTGVVVFTLVPLVFYHRAIRKKAMAGEDIQVETIIPVEANS
ncbi:putative glutamate/gamma-aminobutyrate antiporter [Maridesulfovibrio ferrireducens]|uniref:Putative glutamate/gamma-aminobutyrate antiporter n=1 Tax=Maridesulfovibrio ferrireducens TaxID=246191 RepID=A0A1G9C9Q6_9BACT|nr:amino acid permease [Maridesulfovibrio ferrireducens]SDK48397.1 putative glutamate/gamma-aminobutyrate antiporter [Maridesulfovibrio ferrireducens]